MLHNNKVCLESKFAATQLPNTHISINFSSPPNRNGNPPPVIAPHQLVNSQIPVIPLRIAPQVSTFNKPPRNPVCSPHAHPLAYPNAPKFSLNRNPDLNLWRFPQNKPPNVNRCQIMQQFSTTFNRYYHQALLTRPIATPSHNRLHQKMLLATTQQPVSTK